MLKFLKENRTDEVRYIDTTESQGYDGKVKKRNWRDIYSQESIKSTDNIRVYHGCDLKTAVLIAKEGLSGKEWHPRKYSYEAGMNPVGLFVSTSFNKVKLFANPFGGSTTQDAAVIIEFTAKATDLDTPVWNGQDTFFGQGSCPMPFRDKEERDTQKRHYHDFASKDEYDYVKKSDNPAMAYNIFHNREHQALFIGDLSPNMIKRFWVKSYDKHRSQIESSYRPMKRVEFLKQYGNDEFYEDGTYNQYSQVKSFKYYKPTEDFTTWEDFARRMIMRDDMKWLKYRAAKKYGGDLEKCIEDEVKEVLSNLEFVKNDASYFKDHMWPKQLRQVFGKEEYNKNFDRFGIGYPNESKERKLDKIITEELQKHLRRH